MNPEPVLAQERTLRLHVAEDVPDAEVRRLVTLLDRLLGDAVSAIQADLRRAAAVEAGVSLTLSSR